MSKKDVAIKYQNFFKLFVQHIIKNFVLNNTYFISIYVFCKYFDMIIYAAKIISISFGVCHLATPAKLLGIHSLGDTRINEYRALVQ